MLGLYWDKIPRAFGNPYQEMVFDKKYLMTLIRTNNGLFPCFISHNSFRLSKYGYPSEIHMSKIFAGDLDNKNKPENALLDLRKMVRFAIDMDHPIAPAFTAGKGFHAYLLLEPEYYKVGANLKDAIRAVQLYFRGLGQEDENLQEYKNLLRTHDPQILGDERRLCRVWMTKYVSGSKDKKTKDYRRLPYHCCPLTYDMVLNWSFKKIREYSLEPDYIKYDWSDYEPLTLKEFIKKYDIKKSESYINKPYDSKDGKIVEYKGLADDFILHIFPDRPCIAEGICDENPDHRVRFAAVTYLHHRIGMSKAQIFNLLYSRNWIDRDNVRDCKYQIDHIFRNGYNVPNCEWLRKHDFCIGFDKCEELKEKVIPGYNRFNAEEWT